MLAFALCPCSWLLLSLKFWDFRTHPQGRSLLAAESGSSAPLCFLRGQVREIPRFFCLRGLAGEYLQLFLPSPPPRGCIFREPEAAGTSERPTNKGALLPLAPQASPGSSGGKQDSECVYVTRKWCSFVPAWQIQVPADILTSQASLKEIGSLSFGQWPTANLRSASKSKGDR